MTKIPSDDVLESLIRIGNRKKYKEIHRMNGLIGNRNSGRIWLMKVLLKSVGETWCRGVHTLPVRLMILQWSREHTWNQVPVSTVYLRTFRRIRIVKICLKTKKKNRASCRRRANAVMPRADNFGELIAADHKVLSEESESRNNHRYAVVVQDLATQWLQSYPCKTKTPQETHKNLMKFLEPTRKPKVIYTDISLEFGKFCEELSWSHCTSTPHRSETNGIAERAVRRIKEGTSVVLLQSGLDKEWWADSTECYCYLRNIQDLLSAGKTPYERWFGVPFNGLVIAFGAMVEYRPISAKDLSKLHQFGPKALQAREESGKETLWSQTLRNWKRWTHQNSTPEGSMQRKC